MGWMNGIFKRGLRLGSKGLIGRLLFLGLIVGLSAQSFSQISQNVDLAGLQITTTSLPNGVQNVTYSQTLSARGGVPPYTWSLVSGKLPTGLTLSSGGIISGIPTAIGVFNFTVQVQDFDTSQQIDTQALSITINPPLDITTTSLPNGVQNVSHFQTLPATGGKTLGLTFPMSPMGAW